MYQKLYEELILSKDVNIKMKQDTCEIIPTVYDESGRCVLEVRGNKRNC